MMKFLFTILVLAVFAVGIGIGSLIGLQLPTTNDALTFETHTASSRALSFNSVQLADPSAEVEPLKSIPSKQNLEGPVERASPADWIKESQIEMRPDGVFIHLNNPQWAVLADTNSMDPVFDAGSHLIQVYPGSAADVHVGDIVSYQSPLGFSTGLGAL